MAKVGVDTTFSDEISRKGTTGLTAGDGANMAGPQRYSARVVSPCRAKKTVNKIK